MNGIRISKTDREESRRERQRRNQEGAPGYVYFVEATSTKRVKIGFSLHSPAKRLRQLQQGCSERLRIIVAVVGSRVLERDLHRRFAAYRIVGEWFEGSEEIWGFIRRQMDAQQATGDSSPMPCSISSGTEPVDRKGTDTTEGGYVAYYRVSTDRQGRSGLGLEAQREAVMRLAGDRPVHAEYTEVESGKRHTNRPQLIAAMAHAKRMKATLLIAKLDRLARNVHFISGLMESGVDFVAADMPKANRLTVHIMAAFAEHEREAISQRTKDALAAIKAQGRKLGNPRWQESVHKAAAARRGKYNVANAGLIAELRRQGLTLRDIAKRLNESGMKTSSGAAWYASSVRAVLGRIGGKPETEGPKGEPNQPEAA